MHAVPLDVGDFRAHSRERHTGRSNLRTRKVFRYHASGLRIFDQSRSENRYAAPAWPMWRSAGIPSTFTFVHGTTRTVLRATAGSNSAGPRILQLFRDVDFLRATVPARAARLLRFCIHTSSRQSDDRNMCRCNEGQFRPPKACRRPQNNSGAASRIVGSDWQGRRRRASPPADNDGASTDAKRATLGVKLSRMVLRSLSSYCPGEHYNISGHVLCYRY